MRSHRDAAILRLGIYLSELFAVGSWGSNFWPGRPRLGWFKALTKSARSSRGNRSLKLTAFASDKLTTDSLGPLRVLRPSLPNANTLVVLPSQGVAKAEVLNHWALVLGPLTLPTTLGNQLQPLLTSPPEAVPPTLQP
jgi:hypothetical protein